MSTRVLVAALAAAIMGVSATPASAVSIGIADQKTNMFTDPLFAQLKIRKARLVVPWDALGVRSYTHELDVWLRTARNTGVRPLVSFGRSRRPSHRRKLPTVKGLQRTFRQLRLRYPWVTEWASWNEANHCSQATCNRPDLVARYYDALRRACPTCTILGAEVLDQPNMVTWVRAFERATKVRPKVWGLHNYLDANRMRTIGTRRLLAHTRGQVWFTETGGIVWRRRRDRIHFNESAAHAARATRWVFEELVPLSRRITRVYLYHWNPAGPQDNWDSALVSLNGTPRPAYEVVRREVARR